MSQNTLFFSNRLRLGEELRKFRPSVDTVIMHDATKVSIALHSRRSKDENGTL